jgi:hypothetical protein
MDTEQATELVTRIGDVPDDYFTAPLPSPFDETVATAVDAYIGGDDADKAAIVDATDNDRAWTLSAYAERAASLAVHQTSPEPLVRGLVAIGLASTQLYHKELIILLALFWRSAERLGVDGALLFTSAADLLGDIAPSWIRAFPAREPGNRTLAAMWYEEHEEPNGLLYRRTF